MSPEALVHSSSFKARRFLNWFPLGVAYAMLYMGRYNLTVAKGALGSLITKEDFGIIFGTGTVVYALAFLLNGPFIDRMGGRRGMLLSVGGAAVANVAMGFYVNAIIHDASPPVAPLWVVLTVLYSVNMYFQSFGAVSLVKVNAHWFHVRERGGFSGIFGMMISSGVYFAFSGNEWLIGKAELMWPGEKVQAIVFFVPAAALFLMLGVEALLLRDRPSQAGHQDFDSGDESIAKEGEHLTTGQVMKRIFSNRVLLIIALVELCTGVVRQGVMQWFPIYTKEVWAFGRDHFLVAQWGLILFVAGVIGGNVAGWVSDVLFQSRRGPAALGLYALLAVCTVGMTMTLAMPATEVASVRGAAAQGDQAAAGLQAGDRIIAIAGTPTASWAEVTAAVACVVPTCKAAAWDAEECSCKARLLDPASAAAATPPLSIAATVERGGQRVELSLKDPKPVQRAGDKRLLEAEPKLPMSPYLLAVVMFLMSLCVIGVHGLLSGTATMDFGGKKHAATAVGIIDGAVYLGSGIQSFALGYLTTRDWSYWPLFLMPFVVVGMVALTRIWHARPRSSAPAH